MKILATGVKGVNTAKVKAIANHDWHTKMMLYHLGEAKNGLPGKVYTDKHNKAANYHDAKRKALKTQIKNKWGKK